MPIADSLVHAGAKPANDRIGTTNEADEVMAAG